MDTVRYTTQRVRNPVIRDSELKEPGNNSREGLARHGKARLGIWAPLGRLNYAIPYVVVSLLASRFLPSVTKTYLARLIRGCVFLFLLKVNN